MFFFSIYTWWFQCHGSKILSICWHPLNLYVNLFLILASNLYLPVSYLYGGIKIFSFMFLSIVMISLIFFSVTTQKVLYMYCHFIYYRWMILSGICFSSYVSLSILSSNLIDLHHNFIIPYSGTVFHCVYHAFIIHSSVIGSICEYLNHRFNK